MTARVARIVGPTSSAFPRWGYLDKYAVNEYMARSLALTVMLVFIGGALLQWLPTRIPRTSPPEIPVPRPAHTEPVILGPPPSVIEHIKVVQTHGGAAVVRPPVFVPVPVRGLETDVLPQASGSGVGQSPEGTFEPSYAPPPAEVVIVPPPLAWPSPDDVVVVEKDPVLVTMQPPIYPEIAREAGIEGTVVVRVLVDAQGSVRDRSLVQSIRGLDEAALAAAATAVFRPALQQDKPVAVWVVLPIEFRLRGSGCR